MTTEQVPLAAQIEKVRREIGYAQEDHAEMAERLWSAVLATLQQHEHAMAVVDQQANDDGLWFAAQTAPEAYLQQELRKLHAAIEGAVLDDAASAVATPAGKGETG